jgi:hypothetical protein
MLHGKHFIVAESVASVVNAKWRSERNAFLVIRLLEWIGE